jgi:hypothetical protein
MCRTTVSFGGAQAFFQLPQDVSWLNIVNNKIFDFIILNGFDEFGAESSKICIRGFPFIVIDLI